MMKVGNEEYCLQYGGGEHYIIEKICKMCKYQPAKILKVIRRIEAAVEWCKRRTKGRKRTAEEILRQQKKAVDVITALNIAYKLSKT